MSWAVGVSNEYLVNVATFLAEVLVSELPFWWKTVRHYRIIIPSDTYHIRLAIPVAPISEGNLSLHLVGEPPVAKRVREGT